MLEYALSRTGIGGLRLAARKQATTKDPIRQAFIPRRLVLAAGSLSQEETDAIEIGQRVRRGQTLVAHAENSEIPNVHAPTSGYVRAVEQRPVAAGSALRLEHCIIIETDGKNEILPATDAGRQSSERSQQLEQIRAAGIVGLGGAAFPTARKIHRLEQCKTLIVNGAECEPYISCDDMLMRRSAAEVVAGSLIVCDLANAAECIIAIERDKPDAIQAMTGAAIAADDERLRIAEIPSIYPAGGERQLIELLTGVEIPSERYPSDLGYLCQNIGTVYAVYRWSAESEPLLSRVVTVAGRGVATPSNIEILIGTPIEEVIEHCGGYTGDVERLIIGGSMMGISLPDDSFAVTKSTNCIIAAVRDEFGQPGPETACIRCGDCASVCPVHLMPQELLRAARLDKPAEFAALGLEACIECGCCDVVCPSHIRLTQSFRIAKIQNERLRQHRALANDAEHRYQSREARLLSQSERERADQSGLIEELGTSQDQRANAIEAAVQRARRSRNTSAGP